MTPKKIIVDFSGTIFCDGRRYPLLFNGKRFAFRYHHPDVRVFANEEPKWMIDTALDFRSHDSKWKFSMKNNRPMYTRSGFEKFENIEECIKELTDQGLEAGVVYKDYNCILYIPPSLLINSASLKDKIIFKFLKFTKYNLHSKCPMRFLLNRNKWFKWACDVCDFGIDPGTIPEYRPFDEVMMVKLVTKDVEIMVEEFFKSVSEL